MLVPILHIILFTSLAMFIRTPTTAKYHNYLTGKGAVVLDQTVGTLELIDGTRFMHDPDGYLTIIVTYGELGKGILGMAMRGLKTCRIIISHAVNPETSITYDEADLRSILAHEIGHCWNLDHNKSERHVMYWSYDGKPHNYDQLSWLVEDIKKMRGAK